MAATKFLDNVGLSYFWTKLKDWIASAASNLVHRTGNELVQGIKEFKNDYNDTIINDPTHSHSIVLRSTEITKGMDFSTLDAADYLTYIFQDKSGSLINWEGRLGYISYTAHLNNSYDVALVCCRNDNTISSTYLSVGYDSDGVAFALAPQTSTTRTHRNDIVTRGFLEDKGYLTTHQSLDDKMKRGSYERIDGTSSVHKDLNDYKTAGFYNVKTTYVDNCPSGIGIDAVLLVYPWNASPFCTQELTESADSSNIRRWIRKLSNGGWSVWKEVAFIDSNFSNYLPLTGGTVTGNITAFGAAFNQKHSSYIKGNSYSSNVFLGQGWYDKNGTGLADILYYLNTPEHDGNAWIGFRISGNPNYNESTGATLGVMVTSSGQTFATCPTPSSTTDNSVKIATTAWVRTATGNTALNAANVTGTVAIAHGGTGATTRETAVSSLFNSNIGTNISHFLTGTSGFGNSGWSSVANVKTVLGLDTDYVKTTGNQFISGNKYFYSAIIHRHPTFDVTTMPDSNQFFNEYWEDKNGKHVGRLLYYQNSAANGGSRTFSFEMSDMTGAGKGLWSTGYSGTPTASSTFGYFNLGSMITQFKPTTANCSLGANNTNYRWGQIYSSSTTISTSDERMKDEITEVPEEILDCWESIPWLQFKMKDAIAKKGNEARLHNGTIAQVIDKIFKEHNLDINKYGLFCYDEWDEEKNQYDDEGNLIYEGTKAGNLYSIRYEEALCMEAAYQRRKNKILENRISELETQVQNMLQILESLKGA